jgi:spermidine synthase
LYGVNSLGASVGAILAGFIMIPWIGTTTTVAVASLALFACGMAWVKQRYLWVLGAALAAVAMPFAEFPSVAHLLPRAHGGDHDLYRYEDAMAITHVVERADGQRMLLSDLQRMDAATDPVAVALQMNQARLPLLLHPRPRSVLFLGLGTGISAAGSAPYTDIERTAVELSEGAIRAARDWFAPFTAEVLRATRVVHDDIRRFLRVDGDHYDVIIGDVFHPDLVGRSALLSVQQFRRVKARLATNGVFVQWLALNQFDLEALQTVLRSFRAVYPEGVLFLDGFRLAMVGPQGDLDGAATLLRRVEGLGVEEREARTGGEDVWTWMGRYWGPIDVPDGGVQEEWWPRIEYHLPRVRYARDVALVPLLEWLAAHRSAPREILGVFKVPAEQRESLERGYVATALALRSWLAEIAGNEDEAARLIRFAYEANPRDRWIGIGLADRMLATIGRASAAGLDRRRALLAILKISPDHAEALRELWHLENAAGDLDSAHAYLVRLQAVSPLDREALDAAK